MGLFQDKAIADQIEREGFIITDLLDSDDVKELRSSYRQLRKLARDSISGSFWPSGRHEDPAVRQFAKNSVEKVVPGKLKALLNMEEVRLIGGTYLVKPSSRKSALNPHQDSSHVDERFGFSVYAWIPLQDTNRWNGCFMYLPGSHRWGIDQRSLNVPWPLADQAEKLWKFLKPLPMRSGQVLFFHSALIHASRPNFTFRTRLAVNYYIHPKASPFIHFYQDDSTPENKVEMYEVTPEFYYDEDFEKKPAQKYPLLDVIDKSPFEAKEDIRLIVEEHLE